MRRLSARSIRILLLLLAWALEGLLYPWNGWSSLACMTSVVFWAVGEWAYSRQATQVTHGAWLVGVPLALTLWLGAIELPQDPPPWLSTPLTVGTLLLWIVVISRQLNDQAITSAAVEKPIVSPLNEAPRVRDPNRTARRYAYVASITGLSVLLICTLPFLPIKAKPLSDLHNPEWLRITAVLVLSSCIVLALGWLGERLLRDELLTRRHLRQQLVGYAIALVLGGTLWGITRVFLRS